MLEFGFGVLLVAVAFATDPGQAVARSLVDCEVDDREGAHAARAVFGAAGWGRVEHHSATNLQRCMSPKIGLSTRTSLPQRRHTHMTLLPTIKGTPGRGRSSGIGLVSSVRPIPYTGGLTLVNHVRYRRPMKTKTKTATGLVRVNYVCEACGGTGGIDGVDPKSMRRHREAKGVGLRELARRLDFSASYLSDVERGRRTATDRIVKEYEKL